MNIKPIKNKSDYQNALKRLDVLMDAKKGTLAFDELEILSILIEQYESEHFPVETPDPIEALKFYMEQNNLTNKDLEDVIGSKGRVSNILNKKRPLSINMLRAISTKFSIPAEILIKKYPIKNRDHEKHNGHRMAATQC
jgi:HTH-type transcriptional regulator/antitoxin HigA